MKTVTNTLFESPFGLWVVLILLSTVSLTIFEGRLSTTISGTIIVLIAAFKSRLVILHYMEAKRAPANWRFLYETWNFACTALIIIGNWVAIFRRV